MRKAKDTRKREAGELIGISKAIVRATMNSSRMGWKQNRSYG